jgi:hypothetical protein
VGPVVSCKVNTEVTALMALEGLKIDFAKHVAPIARKIATLDRTREQLIETNSLYPTKYMATTLPRLEDKLNALRKRYEELHHNFQY